MNDSYKTGEASGLIKEEVAFYDALASHDTAEQVLGDDILKVIANEHRLEFARFCESQNEDYSSETAEEVRPSTRFAEVDGGYCGETGGVDGW